MRFLWARMCFGTNYSTTEYEHDISPFYWKLTYYKQGLFVDSTPEYGVRTVGFHILLYINIIPKMPWANEIIFDLYYMEHCAFA